MLVLSDNSKVKFKKNHYNTFGLYHGLPEQGGTCPGATVGEGGCMAIRDGLVRKTCYVEKLAQIYPAFANRIRGNSDMLVGKTKEEMVVLLEATVNSFVKKSKDNLNFRLHTSGDFFSLEYAEAWAEVMKKFPNVRFWAYTRSFIPAANYVAPLIGIPNLSLYLSCDPNNYEEAEKVFDQYKDQMASLGLAWLGADAPNTEKNRWVKCPANSGKIKNEDTKGACAKCRLCVDRFKIRTKNIQFDLT